MSKCTTCRKNDVMDTWWDKTKEWAIYKLFPKVLVDINQDKFTQGFSDGYKMGCKHTKENQANEFKIYEGQN